MKTIWTIIDKIWWSLLASDTLTDKLIIGNFVLFFPRSAEEHPRANSALCKRDVGAGGQNFKKAIFHTFFIEYDKK